MERRRPALRCVGCGRGPASGTLRQASSLLLARAVARPTVSQSHCWISRVGTRHTSFRFPDVIQLSSRYQSPERSPQSARSLLIPRDTYYHVLWIFATRRPWSGSASRVKTSGERARGGPATATAMRPGEASPCVVRCDPRRKGVTLRMFWRFFALISQQNKCSDRGPMSSGNSPFLIE